MYLIIGGLSHKTAPVEIREKLEIPHKKLEEALTDLLKETYLSEAVIVSTCNRSEVYVAATALQKGKQGILKFFSRYHNLSPHKLSKYLYFHHDLQAIQHLFEVAASLDSMVVGEAQILGQVKEAYYQALGAGATSIILNRLFAQALSVGKRARTETEIGESAVSISYAAVELAKKVFENLAGHTVMIIGAGKMSELTAKHLLSSGVSSVLVSNRTYERAVELAERFKGEAVLFDQRFEYMVQADIVISSTAAPHFIIEKESIAQVITRRKGKAIFLIDIAVPRDIDPEVNKLDNVFLYDIDDLEGVVKANIAQRAREARKVGNIIQKEVKAFISWLNSLQVTPTIAALKKKAEDIRKLETKRVLSKLPHLSTREKNLINALTGVIVNKLLHKPIVKTKECANKKDGYVYIESLRHLFDLEEEKKR